MNKDHGSSGETRSLNERVRQASISSVLLFLLCALFISAVQVVPATAAKKHTKKPSVIIYVCDYNLCSIHSDGKKKRQLTNDGSNYDRYSSPSISQDGVRLVFIKKGVLYLSDKRARKRAALIRKRRIRSVALDRAGRQLLIYRRKRCLGVCAAVIRYEGQIYRIEGSKLQHVATLKEGAGYPFDWMGNQLLGYDSKERSPARKPCILSADFICGAVITGPVHESMHENAVLHFVDTAASPDGSYIATSNIYRDKRNARGMSSYTMWEFITVHSAATGRPLRDLSMKVSKSSGPIANPLGDIVWSPDGRKLAFTRENDLYTIRVRGKKKNLKKIASKAESPTWGR